jgi:hypothetical protein
MLQDMKRQREMILRDFLALDTDKDRPRKMSGLRLPDAYDDHAMKKDLLRDGGGSGLRRDLGDLGYPLSKFEQLESKFTQIGPRNGSSAKELQRIQKPQLRLLDKNGSAPPNTFTSRRQQVDGEFEQLGPDRATMSDLGPLRRRVPRAGRG